MRNYQRYIGWVMAIGMLGFTAGCGSSGDGGANGAAVSFAIPSGVDVLKVDTQGSSNYLDAGTDYSQAEQHFHVSHPVGEALSTTSQIMCFLSQLGITDMWSEAALPRVYLVGVDESKCDSESGGPSQGAATGGSTSATATALTMVTVRLSREAVGFFPRAEIWFEEVDNGQQGELRASIDVLAVPSATLPYGRFNLYFAQYMNGQSKGGGNLLVSGTAAAPISYTFFENFSDGGNTEQKAATVEMQADGSNLKAAIQAQSPWNGDGAWVVATNSTSVKANNKNSSNAAAGSVSQVNLNGGICLSKDNFKYRIHGYGLYEEGDGSKVDLQTGVQCQYTDSLGKARNCNISRQGTWFEPESNGAEHSFVHNDTVVQRAWGSQAAYDGRVLTLFVAPGKLTKYTVKKYTLAEIRGVELRMFDNTDSKEYIVKYRTIADDGAASDNFYKMAEMQWSMNGPPSKLELGAPVLINIAADEWKWFFSDTVGGISYVGGNSFITARLEEMVTPTHAAFAGGEMEFKCLNHCPRGGISQANLSSWGGPYEADPANVGAALDYVFTQADMALHRGATGITDPEVKLNSSVTFDDPSSIYQWGVESGALVPAADIGGYADLWAIYDTENNVYYQYRIGPSSWDKLVLVKDGGTFLTFDEPLVFDYTHTTANDRNGDSTFNNKKFLLRYQGEGHIDGFPWDQIDRDGDGTPDMWFPRVSLKDNVQLINGSGNFRIKGLFGDLTLDAAGANCSGLNLALPLAAVPTAKSGNPSNISTSKPDHGTCQFDTDSDTASVGCSN